MARCTIDAVNDPMGVPLYPSINSMHPFTYLKQGTEVGTLGQPRNNRQEIYAVLKPENKGWVNTANLICPVMNQTLISAVKSGLTNSSSFSQTSPTSGNLTAIDSSLSYNKSSIPTDLVLAHSNTTLFAQAATKGVLKQRGVNIDDPNFYKTETYYKEFVTQLTELGFIVENVADDKVNRNTYSGEVKISEILTDIVGLYLGAEAFAEFKDLMSILPSANDDKVSNFLNFWWSNAKFTDSESRFAIGPLEDVNGMPTSTIVHYSFDIYMRDWRSLFVSYHHEKFDVYSTAIKLTLDMDIYHSVQDMITNALKGQIANHIKHIPLDFGN